MKTEAQGPVGGAWRSSTSEEEEEEDEPVWGPEVSSVLEGSPGLWADQVRHFRSYCFRGSRGPQETCARIRALCHQWLQPEKNSKARMMDLVIVEQFLKILPPEMEAWVRDRRPQSSAHAVALAEAFLPPQVSKVAPKVKKEPVEKKILQGGGREAISPGEVMDVGDHKPATKAPSRLLSPQRGIDTLDVPPNEDPVAVKVKLESSAEEDPLLPDLGGTTLLMEVVEERFESVASSARGDSKAKRKKETTAGTRVWDRDGAYISPKGSYLPKRPSLGGNPTGNERSQPQPSEFEKSFLQQIFRGKGGRAAPAGEQEHRCLDCGKTFNVASKLKLHVKIHSEEKPFECPECGKRFRHKGNLRPHQRIHLREKPFRCEECGRCFAHPSIHRKHVKYHETKRVLDKQKGASSRIGPPKDRSLNGEATQRDVPPDAGRPDKAEECTQVSIKQEDPDQGVE